MLWNDRMLEPWTSEPFSRDAKRHRYFGLSPSLELSELETEVDARGQAGFEPLAVGCCGHGDSRYAAIWVPKGREVLGRTFLVKGIGNVANARYEASTLPGESSPIAPSGAGDDASTRRVLSSELTDVSSPRLAVELTGLSSGGTALPGTLDGAVQRGLTPATGGTQTESGADQPELEEELPPPQGATTHPFDRLMRTVMRLYGTRAGQIAVLRGGQLGYLRSFTNAEVGYPITDSPDRFRWGSVTKAMTASVLAHHYMGLRPDEPLVGVLLRLDDELGISRPDEPAFHGITIRQALTHTSGIGDGQYEPQGPSFLSYADIYRAATGNEPGEFPEAQLSAGDMRKALENWQGDVVTGVPGEYNYNNYVYIALAELMGNVVVQDYGRYEDAAIQSLPTSLQGLSPLTGQGYRACRDRREVAYHGRILPIGRSPNDPEPWGLHPYLGNPAFGSGAGWWALSAYEMAKVMRQLTVHDNPLWPTGTEKLAIHKGSLGWGAGHYSFEFGLRPDAPPAGIPGVGPSTGGGLGEVGGGTSTYDPNVSPTTPKTLRHNGAGIGSSAWAVHLFASATKTIDIIAVFNNDGPNDFDFYTAALAAAQEVEAQGLWAPFDLFALENL